jgi:proteasome-associated ATPase
MISSFFDLLSSTLRRKTMAQTRTEARKQQSAHPSPNSSAPKTLEEHLAWLKEVRASGADLWPLAEGLLQENYALRAAVDQVQEHQQQLRQEIEALTAPEHYPAVITAVHPNGALTAEVHAAGMSLEVAVHPEIAPEKLRVGVCGLVTKSRNCLLKVDEVDGPKWQELGRFEGFTEDRRRILLRYQEQLVAATPADELAITELRKGDLVGFDIGGPRLAYTRVEAPGKEDLFCEDTPTDRFEELGGLDPIIAKLKRIVGFRLRHSGLAARYQLPEKRGILLEGPPGNGKTKLARCLARYIADLVPGGECRFMVIAGSSDYSMWLGQSEQRLIARFDAARETALRTGLPVLMCFEEIDAIGQRRGTDFGSGAPDRILNTLLTQLDGIQKISNLIVLATTNRADRLDNGLVRPGRFGDYPIRIPAPNRAGGRAILTRYLGTGIPLIGERESLIEALLSRLYSPRGEYAELARVTLRDGRKVALGARDFVSGAMLENLVLIAAEEAACREAETAVAGGITEADLAAALDRELRGSVALLTPHNVRSYVARLPQDVDPVAVEPVGNGPGSAVYARIA